MRRKLTILALLSVALFCGLTGLLTPEEAVAGDWAFCWQDFQLCMSTCTWGPDVCAEYCGCRRIECMGGVCP